MLIKYQVDKYFTVHLEDTFVGERVKQTIYLLILNNNKK